MLSFDSLLCVINKLDADDHLCTALTCVSFRDAVRESLRARESSLSTSVTGIMTRRPASWRWTILKLGGARTLTTYAAAKGDETTLAILRTSSKLCWSLEAERAAVAAGNVNVLEWAEANMLLTKPIAQLLPPLQNVLRMMAMPSYTYPGDDNALPVTDEYFYFGGGFQAGRLPSGERARDQHRADLQAFVRVTRQWLEGFQTATEQA